MGLFENFPYTNFHEINLDQIIKIMRQMQDEWQQVKTDWDSMQDFINNYFDNLDVSEEVLQALQTMAGDGELNTIIDPVIVTETAAWLAEHITPTSPAVDNTLSIAGAAADAKATGDAVADLKEDLCNVVDDLKSYFGFENKSIYLDVGQPIDYSAPNVNRLCTPVIYVPDGESVKIYARGFGRYAYAESTNGSTITSGHYFQTASECNLTFNGPTYFRLLFANATDTEITASQVGIVSNYQLYKLNNEVDSIKDATEESNNSFQNSSIKISYNPSIIWVNKGVNNTTGEVDETAMERRCCSPELIPVLGFNKITWTATTPFNPTDALVYYYDTFGNYIGYEYRSSKPIVLTNNKVAFIRIEFANSTAFDATTFNGVLTLTTIIDDFNNELTNIANEIPLIGIGAMHKSKNLFNKSTAVSGYYVQNSTGTLQPLADWYASDYIPIRPSTKYTMRYTNQGAFYTSGKTYISGFSGYSTGAEDNPNTVITPGTAAYMRVSVAPLQYNGYMLEKGETYTGFEEYGIYVLERDAVEKFVPTAVQSKNILPDLYHATAEAPVRIKLLGDSITAGVGGTGYATNGDLIADTGERMNPNGYCWANLFKAYLESNFHCNVVNFGISGKNSGYYAQRASSMIESTDDIVICMLGTNDRGEQGATTIDSLYPNLETLRARAESVEAKFIPMACIPADLANETTHTKHMEDVNFVINAFASDHNIEYVDVFTAMEWWCEYTGTALSSYLDSGALHPNDSGYLVMYKIITRALGIATKIDNADW